VLRRRPHAAAVLESRRAQRERERRVRELVGGNEGAGQRPLRAWARGGVSAESSPAHLRSSNRASLPGRAESSFPYEVGNAQVGITGLTNS
jgi:hypothetical protein